MRTLDIGRPLDVQGLVNSRNVPSDGYEVEEGPLYDRATYLAAGSTTLDFFATATNDRTISNLVQPGLVPIGEFFHAKRIFLVPEVEATVSPDLTAAGRVRDLDRVLVMSRGILTITPAYSNRPKGPFPIHLIGSVGGTEGFGWGTDAPGAGISAVVEHAKASRHGGLPTDFILRGGETFAASIRWGVPLAITADMPLQLIIWGFRYRKAA